MTDNNITIIGNITRDPELRFTPSSQSVVTFGMAVNRRWQNRQSQEWEESTSFFDIVCWSSLADNVAESLSKGARVIVTGRLEQRTWETQDGEKRSKVEVIADEIGPSLRWATARPQKVERRNAPAPGQPGGYSGGQPGGYSGGQPGGQGSPPQVQEGTYAAQGAGLAGGGGAPPGYDNTDEEPF